MDMPTSPLARLNDPTLLKTDALIGGAWVTGTTRFDVLDPATGQRLADVANLGPAEAEQAIAAADAALPGWRGQTGKQRHALLLRWYQLLVEHADDLARILTAEQGKPLAEARGEILYGASFVEWFAEEAKRVNGETLPPFDNNRRLLVLKQPIGVCAAITPWNFPLAMITRKVAPALAAGCTVVIKPAELTPLTALAAAELAVRAGLPAGVLNVLTADSTQSIAAGKVFCASDVVRHISFTGSTEVGRILMAQSAPTVKKLSLELGGNAPFIVFDDADLDAAVQGLLAAKFRNGGQTCVCPNRVYVQAGVHDAFVETLALRVGALRVGPATDLASQIGPMINARAVDKMDRHVRDAVARGARVVVGGQRVRNEVAAGPNYYAPTVLVSASPDMECACEETFGPVVPVFRFDDEAEVVAQANDTPFGLAAYFYSRDAARIWRVADALETGIVGVNEGALAAEAAPFGGVKASGYGREGSTHGLDDYLHVKYVCQGGLG